MKKRHEIIALLAAAAGLGMGTAADAAISQRLTDPTEEVLSGQGAMSDQTLSRMIQLAEAKGHERSNSENSAHSSSKSPQSNGNARGFEHSENPNAAGNPDKPRQGKGKDHENEGDDNEDDDNDHHHHNPS